MATIRNGFHVILGVVLIQVGLSYDLKPSEFVPYICSDEIPNHKVDTALFTVMNDKNSHAEIRLYIQSQECVKCDLMPLKTIKQKTNCSILLDTRWGMRAEIRSVVNDTVQDIDPSCNEGNLTMHFLEYGNYTIFISSSPNHPDQIKCSSIVIMNDPLDANIPIYVAIGIGIFVGLIWILIKYLYGKGYLHRVLFFWSTEGMMVDLGTPTTINAGDETSKEVKSPQKERLKSLDTIRGLSILIMIFVNYRGGYYCFFKHSIWNGLNLADLVFPWFIWIMGTSMIFSFNGQLKRNTPRLLMAWNIFKRASILFLLGLLVNSDGIAGGVELSSMRIPGVLQRFAGTYLVVAMIHLVFVKTSDENQHRWWAPIRDLTDYWPEWIVHLALVGVWITLTYALPVPNCPTGYLGPGGLHDGGKHFNCTGGAAGYIDRLVFGNSHIYQHPTAQKIYNTTVPYDPEGLLGTLTSCFICFLGLQAGKILFQQKDWIQRCKRFIIWGVVLGVIAIILSKGSKNDGWMPISKNLWSLSFVIAMASLAFFLFCACYLLIDVWKVWSGAPFCYPGLNPILIYIGHEMFINRFPVYFRIDEKTHANQLALSVWGTFLWFLVALYLYCKNIIVTI